MKEETKGLPDKNLVKILQASGLVEYLEYLQSGKRIMWVNFKAGIARGFGVAVGMSLIVGLFIWLLTKLVDVPIVGEYFIETKQYVSDYAENTNYKAEFLEMNQSLREINENLKKSAPVEQTAGSAVSPEN